MCAQASTFKSSTAFFSSSFRGLHPSFFKSPLSGFVSCANSGPYTIFTYCSVPKNCRRCGSESMLGHLLMIKMFSSLGIRPAREIHSPTNLITVCKIFIFAGPKEKLVTIEQSKKASTLTRCSITNA